MGLVDQTDNFLANYQTLKSIKWYSKLLLHLINTVVLNSYILNKKFGVIQLIHTRYREYIAKYLITTSVDSAVLTRKTIPLAIQNSEVCLSGKHFVHKIDSLPGAKRKTPACRCHVHNFTQKQLTHYWYDGLKLPLKFSSFSCTMCVNVTLCITPCFEIYHTI